MSLISADYANLNRQLHENDAYGISGQKWSKAITLLTQLLNTRELLDYGCGKSTLAKSLSFPIYQYDPGVPAFSDLPHAADIVACTDVLEHIEPDKIDSVLDHLSHLTKQVGFFVISTCLADKLLSDGRNAHLIVKNERWWLNRLKPRFAILKSIECKREIIILVSPKNSTAKPPDGLSKAIDSILGQDIKRMNWRRRLARLLKKDTARAQH